MKKILIFCMVLIVFLSNISIVASLDYDQTVQLNDIRSEADSFSSFQVIYDSTNNCQNQYPSTTTSLQQKNDGYDYIIITTENLKDSIESSSFYSWKESLGFTTRIVSISDSLIQDQAGPDLPAKIRNFLRNKYETWGINYVLIVGSHNIIPMRYCYPDPNNHQFNIYDWSQGGEVPTDYYYADLSKSDQESWDSDNDGYYGEFTQDDPDFTAEVYVGRIPTSNQDEVMYTLDKITQFEQDASEWKNNALHAGSMLFYKNQDYQYNIEDDIDGATCLNAIEEDLMKDWHIDHQSEHEGLSPSIYPWDALTEPAFTKEWRSGKYAVVNWAGHGSATGVGRTIWDNDDGNNIPEHSKNELRGEAQININSYLEDDYPSIVFAVSCLVGYPEPTGYGNLGIDMLIKESFGAAVAVLSATRPAAITVNFTKYHSGAEALCYEFNNYMINKSQPLGKALYESKAFVHYNFGWTNWYYEYKNMYNYNLYGDPSMYRVAVSVDDPSIMIDSPAKGIYMNGNKILPFFTAVSIGETLITANTSELVNKVEFYIDDELTLSDTEPPFECTWIEKSFSKHTIRVVGYDTSDRTAEDTMVIWKLF